MQQSPCYCRLLFYHLLLLQYQRTPHGALRPVRGGVQHIPIRINLRGAAAVQIDRVAHAELHEQIGELRERQPMTVRLPPIDDYFATLKYEGSLIK